MDILLLLMLAEAGGAEAPSRVGIMILSRSALEESSGGRVANGIVGVVDAE